ncbi:hypothetical protein BDV40DRAFT_300080 [Aspergillus tamarii]|uniref:Alcohol dehydrogenase-like C-terminal domain-containing protein n=1 Tax=Aspergillus tamarii TaxID=41984 RepID=A0A5N6UWK4_ASPTM|nr:hypothetical protein BDV40DRAFT_300080 [Aspergillus tamarii]
MPYQQVYPSIYASKSDAGPVGLLTRAVVKALGARRILAIDFQSQCSEFAKRYAATDIHLATLKEGGKMVAYSKCHGKHTLEHFGFGERSEGIDCVIECSRAEVGAGPADNLIPMSIFVNKEVRLIGGLRYGLGCYALGVDHVEHGRINLTPLITHKFSSKDAS